MRALLVFVLAILPLLLLGDAVDDVAVEDVADEIASQDTLQREEHTAEKVYQQRRQQKQQQQQQWRRSASSTSSAPALMLTTSDTVSFVYPKEMAYENDYLHIIFKLIQLPGGSNFKITDAAYDNRTATIYFILLNLNSNKQRVASSTTTTTTTTTTKTASATNQSGGDATVVASATTAATTVTSQLVRLTKNRRVTRRQEQSPLSDSSGEATDAAAAAATSRHYNFEIDSNWSLHVVHSFPTSKLLSMDLNVRKRRLYLFEFDRLTKKYSMLLFHLSSLDAARRKQQHQQQQQSATHVNADDNISTPPLPTRADDNGDDENSSSHFTYFTFDQLSTRYFQNDGYLFITVARDNYNRLQVARQRYSQQLYAARHRFSSSSSSSSLLSGPVVPEKRTKGGRADIVLFVSNNQTLNICFLTTMTCWDYFKRVVAMQASSLAPQPSASPSSHSSLSSLLHHPQAKQSLASAVANAGLLHFVPKTSSVDAAAAAATADDTADEESDGFVNYDDYYDDVDQVASSLSSSSSSSSAAAAAAAAITDLSRFGQSSRVESTGGDATASLSAQSSAVDQTPPLYKFGRLMGISFSRADNSLLVNDYGFDCIYKIKFDSGVVPVGSRRVKNKATASAAVSVDNHQLQSIETILSVDDLNKLSQQAQALNPIMSVVHDAHVYWIDYEDGLKTSMPKSNYMRTIYRIKEPVTLRFIQIATELNLNETGAAAAANSNSEIASSSSSSLGASASSIFLLNKLISISKNSYKFKYPPDYYVYNTARNLLDLGNNVSTEQLAAYKSKLLKAKQTTNGAKGSTQTAASLNSLLLLRLGPLFALSYWLC